MAKKKVEKSESEKIKNLIFNIVLWTLGGVAVLIIILWDYIFKGKPIYTNGETNGFVAFGKWWADNIDVVVYTIVVVAIVLLIVALLGLIAKHLRLRNRKAATFVSLFKSLLKWAVIIVGVFLILKKWKVDTKAILASIGIIALVIGLGCQSLISDIVAGIFLVADDAFEVEPLVGIIPQAHVEEPGEKESCHKFYDRHDQGHKDQDEQRIRPADPGHIICHDEIRNEIHPAES